MARKLHAPVPRVTLTGPEAAASLGCGPDYFAEHVAPELRVIRRGRKKLYPLEELQKWALENAEHVLDSE